MYRRILFALSMALVAAALAVGSGAAAPGASAAGRERLDVSVGFEVQSMDDEMGRFIQDKFGMNITIVSLEDDALKLMAATGELPDAFSTWPGIGDPLFTALIRDGMVRDIPDAVLKKYPSLTRYTESVQEVMAHKSMVGKLYMIPRRQSSHKDQYVVGYGVYYRADWAKKLNLKIPTTVDGLYEMLKAFTFDDPDGNGIKDTMGVTGWIWQIHYMPWVDIYNWIQEGGRWIPGYVSDQVIPALQYWNKLYKDGLLDPEFAVANSRKLFYEGKNGVIYGKADPYWTWRQWIREFAPVNPGLDPLETVKYMPPPKKDDASPARWPAAEQRQCTLFRADVSDAKLNRIFEFFEWALSDEGRDFANYGFADKDWRMENGKAVSLLPYKDEAKTTQKPLFEEYPSVSFFGFLSWGITPKTPPVNPTIPESIEKLDDYFQKDLYGPAAVKPNIYVNSIVTPAKEKYNVGEEDAEEQFIAMIATDDPVGQFQAYRKKLLEVMGLQQVIDEVNQVVRQQGIK